MRKLLLFVGLLITGITCAQNYTRDAGLRVGDFFSATYRVHQNENHAVEGILFIGRRGATLGIMKEHFQPALGQISDNLFFEYGYGIHIGFRYTDHYKILNRTYELYNYRFSPLFGVDGLIGVEYRFPEFPFMIGIDIKPYFEYSTIQIFNIYLQSAGISIKYRF